VIVTAIASPESVCARIAHRLAASVGPQRYSMWFGRSARLAYRDQQHCLDVAVPNRFVADWIGRHFQGELRRAASDELGRDVDLSVYVDPVPFADHRKVELAALPVTEGATGAASAGAAEAASRFAAPAVRRENRSAARAAGAPPNLRYHLEDFIVGPSNELAFAAAGRLVEQEDGAASPLFLHGGVGLGKTHLLQGICQRMLEVHPNARVLYTTGEQFTNEFLTAVRHNGIEAFRKRIRRLDLLAVDDVHFLANKAATQQEFLHSFNEIELGGARVVLASDSHPKLIQQFSAALVSRCVRGMVVEVRPPDTATRTKIVRALAARRGISLLETVVAVIAGRCQGSVREIEGTLTKLQALASLTGGRQEEKSEARRAKGDGDGGAVAGGPAAGESESRNQKSEVLSPIGHTLVNRLFSAELQEATPRIVRFETILSVVAEQLQLSKEQVLGHCRQRELVLARSLVIHLARQLTPMSYPEIAAVMSRGSHSAVIAAAQRVEKLLAAGTTVLVPVPPRPGAPASGALEQIALAEVVERLKRAIARMG
jgi:chromosomal replication initiator protein